MKIQIFLALSAILVVLLAGCGKSAPSCSDPKIVKLVEEISRQWAEETFFYFGFSTSEWSTGWSTSPISIGAIRTTGFDEKTGKQECAATVTTNNVPAFREGMAITYTSELTDKDDEPYVTVKGLSYP